MFKPENSKKRIIERGSRNLTLVAWIINREEHNHVRTQPPRIEQDPFDRTEPARHKNPFFRTANTHVSIIFTEPKHLMIEVATTSHEYYCLHSFDRQKGGRKNNQSPSVVMCRFRVSKFCFLFVKYGCRCVWISFRVLKIWMFCFLSKWENDGEYSVIKKPNRNM